VSRDGGILHKMIRSFFRRWWTLRKLREFIYSPGDIHLSNWPMRTRDQRISRGVGSSFFQDWMIESGSAKNISQVKRNIEECLLPSVGYFVQDPEDGNLHLGKRGHEEYVWYFPFVAFFRLEYVKHFALRFFSWAIPVVALYILSRFTNISINITS